MAGSTRKQQIMSDNVEFTRGFDLPCLRGKSKSARSACPSPAKPSSRLAGRRASSARRAEHAVAAKRTAAQRVNFVVRWLGGHGASCSFKQFSSSSITAWSSDFGTG